MDGKQDENKGVLRTSETVIRFEASQGNPELCETEVLFVKNGERIKRALPSLAEASAEFETVHVVDPSDPWYVMFCHDCSCVTLLMLIETVGAACPCARLVSDILNEANAESPVPRSPARVMTSLP